MLPVDEVKQILEKANKQTNTIMDKLWQDISKVNSGQLWIEIDKGEFDSIFKKYEKYEIEVNQWNNYCQKLQKEANSSVDLINIVILKSDKLNESLTKLSNDLQKHIKVKKINSLDQPKSQQCSESQGSPNPKKKLKLMW